MIKIISLLLLSSFAFAQPTSIHYSVFGKYIVDQDGKRTTISGHPHMVCHVGFDDVTGVFQKARGMTIWLIDETDYIKIDHPVCEVYGK